MSAALEVARNGQVSARPDVGEQIERVLISGDLGKLSAEERVKYYNATCQSLGLNPLTRPFDYLSLNGKLTLYARRDCTEQLRKIHGVSVVITGREKVGDLYIVQARATDRSGRTDESIGAVNLGGLKGEALANALMKAETKAKRRVTLSICGLGLLDETEVETVQGARVVPAEVLPPTTPPPQHPAVAHVTATFEVPAERVGEETPSEANETVSERRAAELKAATGTEELGQVAVRIAADYKAKRITDMERKLLLSVYQERTKELA